MIGKRTIARLGAVTAIATVGLGLGAGMASATTSYYANVPGCAGRMDVNRINGHDYVQGFITSTTGDPCYITLHQSNGHSSDASSFTRGVENVTAQLQDSGITSYVVVCNGATGRCNTSTSY
ncbi:hypothetical protein [Kitasatospora brasiliensis]|uniref:hypothetical protein n=1 Tax=Kitasatospora brasiliensis TaxID=3058040 RepID=UPI002931C048|nr:hypothetical protein [Kitasatospora sp. K002]